MRTHILVTGLLTSLFGCSGTVVDHGNPPGPGEALLSWTAPTQNADGTALTDLAGYRVYWGVASAAYDDNLDVGNVTRYTMTGLDSGVTYYFAVTAYDTSGNESEVSNEAAKEMP